MNRIKILSMVLILALSCVLFAGCGLMDSIFGSSNSSSTNPFSKTVTVSLDYNGGSGGDKTFIGSTGEPISLPTPTREGYEFYGWCSGYSKYNCDVYPDSDITLIARWKVLNTKSVTIYDQQTEGKELKISNGKWITFSPAADQVGLKQALEYFKANNSLPAAKIKVTYEAFYNNSAFAISVGNVGYIKIAGSSTGKILYSQNITNIDGYKQYEFNGTVDPKEFVPTSNSNVYLQIYIGSNNFYYDMYFRNAKIEITYVEEEGTIL